MPLSSWSIPSYRSNWNAGRSVLDVTPALLPRPTPCQGWNLGGIGDLPLPAIAMECAGAIEIAVHGWDVSQACGHNRPIPDALAASQLAIAPLIIPETGRHPLFSPPVTVTARAGPGDRLVAYLGRNPPHSMGRSRG
jgi:hypothetical protein